MVQIPFGKHTSAICTRVIDGITLWRAGSGDWFLDAKWTLGERLQGRAGRMVTPIDPPEALEFLRQNGGELCIPKYFPGEIALSIKTLQTSVGDWTWTVETEGGRKVRETTESYPTQMLAIGEAQQFMKAIGAA